MARRFVTYNTEDQAAGLVNVDERGVMMPGGTVNFNDIEGVPFGYEDVIPTVKFASDNRVISTNMPPSGLYGPHSFGGTVYDLLGATIVYNDNGTLVYTVIDGNNATINDEGTGIIVLDSNLFTNEPLLAFASEDNVTVGNYTIPNAGMLLHKAGTNLSVREVYKRNYTTLDREYIPADIRMAGNMLPVYIYGHESTGTVTCNMTPSEIHQVYGKKAIFGMAHIGHASDALCGAHLLTNIHSTNSEFTADIVGKNATVTIGTDRTGTITIAES